MGDVVLEFLKTLILFWPIKKYMLLKFICENKHFKIQIISVPTK